MKKWFYATAVLVAAGLIGGCQHVANTQNTQTTQVSEEIDTIYIDIPLDTVVTGNAEELVINEEVAVTILQKIQATLINPGDQALGDIEKAIGEYQKTLRKDGAKNNSSGEEKLSGLRVESQRTENGFVVTLFIRAFIPKDLDPKQGAISAIQDAKNTFDGRVEAIGQAIIQSLIEIGIPSENQPNNLETPPTVEV